MTLASQAPAEDETQLRCEFKMHGILIADGVIEVKCSSRLCGANGGTVVLHRFSTISGELLETRRFKNPKQK